MEFNFQCTPITKKYLCRFVDCQRLVYPVSLNMTLTLVAWVGVYQMKIDETLAEAMFGNTGDTLTDALINGLGSALALICVAFAMLGFAMFDFRRVVQFWLYSSCILLLFMVSGNLFYAVIVGPEVTEPSALKMFWVGLATGLYGIGGCFSYFTNRLPASVHRGYVICNCSLVSVYYLRCLPGHTTWVVLIGVAAWDLFAVLSPLGPLNMVQQKAGDYSGSVLRFLMFTAGEESNFPLEVVSDVSSSEDESDSSEEESDGEIDMDSEVEPSEAKPTVAVPSESRSATSSASSVSSHSSSSSIIVLDENVSPESQTAADALNDNSFKLGMGDFVFYSVLVGKAATSGSFVATAAAFSGVLHGLCITLVFFNNGDRTTPALPLSILLGICTYLMGLQVEATIGELLHPLADLFSLGF